jgi:AhpD family alkylhydroperoxidase
LSKSNYTKTQKLFFFACRLRGNTLTKASLIKYKIHAMSNLVNEFNDYRTRMNEVILGKNNLVMKRLWNLDTNTYEEGALDKKTKEMLGLVASMVLRCDDCIKYHLGKSHELGITTEQMYEIFAVANIVGGTIVIPHTRRAAEYWEELSK